MSVPGPLHRRMAVSGRGDLERKPPNQVHRGRAIPIQGKSERSKQHRSARSARSKWFWRGLVLADLGAICVAIGVGVAASWGEDLFLVNNPMRALIVVLLLVIWPTMLWKTRSRQAVVLGDGPEEYRRVLVATAWTALLVAGVSFLVGVVVGRYFLIGVVLLGAVLLLVERNIVRYLLRRQLRKGAALNRVFLVGTDEARASMTKELERTNGLFRPVGSLSLGKEPHVEPLQVVEAARRSGADTLFYAPTDHSDNGWFRRLGWDMEGSGINLFVAPSLASIAEPRLSIQPVEGLPLIRVEMPRLSGPARVLKRVIDLVGAGSLLLFLAIPMMFVGARIRLDSPGPVIFKQTRVGRDGKTFECWKFRTMIVDADSQRADLREVHGTDSATFKMTEDPRITGVGHFLRRFSIDELPQLVNVLRGEMSLVGPRPHPLDDVERYEDEAHRRHLAKPGMTGLWQVSGRSELEWEDAVALDLYYVENWSLSMDFLIALRTVKAVFKGSGAC